jgi:hypothetical protein
LGPAPHPPATRKRSTVAAWRQQGMCLVEERGSGAGLTGEESQHTLLYGRATVRSACESTVDTACGHPCPDCKGGFAPGPPHLFARSGRAPVPHPCHRKTIHRGGWRQQGVEKRGSGAGLTGEESQHTLLYSRATVRSACESTVDTAYGHPCPDCKGGFAPGPPHPFREERLGPSPTGQSQENDPARRPDQPSPFLRPSNSPRKFPATP